MILRGEVRWRRNDDGGGEGGGTVTTSIYPCHRLVRVFAGAPARASTHSTCFFVNKNGGRDGHICIVSSVPRRSMFFAQRLAASSSAGCTPSPASIGCYQLTLKMHKSVENKLFRSDFHPHALVRLLYHIYCTEVL